MSKKIKLDPEQTQRLKEAMKTIDRETVNATINEDICSEIPLEVHANLLSTEQEAIRDDFCSRNPNEHRTSNY